MKRHKSLIPLSQDHHHGLIVAQLAKKSAPEYKDLPNDPDGKAEYALHAWESEISIHFKNEEKILFPFVKGKNDELDRLIEEILDEHKNIRSDFEAIKTKINLVEDLDKMGKDLEAHIRKEERLLFNKIQEIFGDRLDHLTGKIETAKDISCKSKNLK